ncbi:plasma-membrane choline transporter-domain-containing protein [Russula earlei]|uniref:Plasma-membrane choline transporter-domain-containing protein n=1 Tax=Russula earlei TaxID=71964 RepID=A0ACC0UHI2_9AGAM|nr:plasma-membrane choline transporter-domain-containing protein [Russula earlei]
MTSSFATYASQFLNRQRSPGGAASLSTEQPLFFSFSTDDGSQHGSGHLRKANDSDLDDGGDPHLRSSDDTAALTSMTNTRKDWPDDNDGPYLRLDEVDPGSQYPATSTRLPGLSQAPSEQSRGWLAHQPTHLRSPSPSSSGLDDSPPIPPPSKALPTLTTSPPPPPPPLSLSLTQSLLPRDGHARPIDLFSLPDPRYISSRSRRKFHDPIWTSIWLTGLSICVLSSLLSLFLTRKPSSTPRSFPLPYTTFLHTVPLIVILTFTSAAVSYTHILLLRVFVKPVVIGTSVFIPATLLISSIWAFAGSFMWESDTVPTWGETWGLRLFALIPLALAFITGRRLVALPQKIHSTSSILTLTTQLLSSQPLLLLLSPTVLLVALLVSIPFLTLTFRLLLVGYFSPPSSRIEWHLHGWANWAIAGTISLWFWSWAVARGALRVTTAAVIAAWYFADSTHIAPYAAQPVPPPAPMDTHRVRAALYRATQPSLGSITLASLLLTLTRILLLSAVFLRRVPAYLPITLRMYTGPLLFAVGYLEDTAGSLSRYALVYVGLTGEGFWISARRARALVASAESGAGRFKKSFKAERNTTDPIESCSIDPDIAIRSNGPYLPGTVTALVGLFCVGLVTDTADTLYLCYCIDKESGDRRRAEVFELFEYNSRRQQPQARQQQGQQHATRVHRPQRVPVPGPHAPQPISQRVEGIASPESSPELSPTDFQVDPRSWAAPAPSTSTSTNAKADDAEPEPELAVEHEEKGQLRGYDVGNPNPTPDGEEDEDEMGGSALFPGSDIF